MLGNDARILIVGASLAGLTTAEALRAEGFAGDVLLVGAEPDLPYSRPPLSKQVLSGAWEVERAVIRTADELHAAGIRTRLGEPATALDRARREVVLADGERLPYDALVIATGVASRSATAVAGHPVPVLRTLEDARRLRTAIESADRIVVLGGGVLGSEIASASRAAGREATLVGRSRHLGLGAVGRLLSSRLIELHRDAGVRLVLGAAVVDVESGRVLLDDGSSVEGDLVVAAIGGDPQTGWLHDSGLDLDDGVLCDATGCAVLEVGTDDRIYAVGDVARWADPLDGRARRIEHQANAIEQALSVGRTLATGESTAAAPPFFWSELHGIRIQAYGSFDPDLPLAPFGDTLEPGRELLASVHRDGPDGELVRGVVGWNAARPFRDARSAVDASARTARTHREVVA